MCTACVVSNWSSAEKDKNGDVFAWLPETFPLKHAYYLLTHSLSHTQTKLDTFLNN